MDLNTREIIRAINNVAKGGGGGGNNNDVFIYKPDAYLLHDNFEEINDQIFNNIDDLINHILENSENYEVSAIDIIALYLNNNLDITKCIENLYLEGHYTNNHFTSINSIVYTLSYKTLCEFIQYNDTNYYMISRVDQPSPEPIEPID